MKNNRGRSPATRKAVTEANLRRKLERIRGELATIAREDSDRLLFQSPKLLQAIYLFQEIGEAETEWSDRASILADELQSLIVEHSYQEAIGEGIIKQGDSFIV